MDPEGAREAESVFITPNPDGFRDEMSAGLNQIVQHVTIGLAAAEQVPAGPVLVPNAFMHVAFGGSPVVNPTTCSDFKRWIVGVGLSQASDVLSRLAERLWSMLWFARESTNGPIQIEAGGTVEDVLYRLGGSKTRSFTNAGWERRLEYLRSEFNVAVGWQNEIRSIGQLRNCIVHRHGRVGTQDITDTTASALSICFRRLALVAVDATGKEVELAQGGIVMGGSSVILKTIAATRAFPRDSIVDIQVDDFGQIMMTLFSFGIELINTAFPRMHSMVTKSE